MKMRTGGLTADNANNEGVVGLPMVHTTQARDVNAMVGKPEHDFDHFCRKLSYV